MKTKLFFELAKQNGIEVSEIKMAKSSSIYVSLFNGEIDTYNVSTEKSFAARGIINNQLGSGMTNIDDKNTAENLIKQILNSAKLIEKKEEPIIFKGSKKYVKRNVFNKYLGQVEMKDKISNLQLMNDFIKSYDPRIENIEVGYEESEDESKFENSYGLKLSNKSNSFVAYCFATLRNGEEVVNYSESIHENDFNKWNPVELAKKMCENLVKKVGPAPCKSKKYKIVLKKEVVSTLTRAFVSAMSAEEVQKHSSKLEGKLNQQVTSKKLTIYEKPTDKTIYFRGYDSEGVATYNKTLVKNGVLQTYLYNLTTAKKDGVESTGNGYGSVAKIGTGTTHLVIKKGKKSFDQLLEKVKNGIFVTDLAGLHAGMDATSGNFSLQAEGFMIEDGKLTKPLNQIVVAGNLYDLFMNVTEVGSDIEFIGSFEACTLVIKSLNVAGK